VTSPELFPDAFNNCVSANNGITDIDIFHDPTGECCLVTTPPPGGTTTPPPGTTAPPNDCYVCGVNPTTCCGPGHQVGPAFYLGIVDLAAAQSYCESIVFDPAYDGGCPSCTSADLAALMPEATAVEAYLCDLPTTTTLLNGFATTTTLLNGFATTTTAAPTTTTEHDPYG
jgi:hypothetical protein